METQLIPNVATVDPMTDQRSPATIDGFIASMLALRIAIVSGQTGHRTKPCRNPNNRHIWNRLYDYINGAIEATHHALTIGSKGPDFNVLQNIASLRQVEVRFR